MLITFGSPNIDHLRYSSDINMRTKVNELIFKHERLDR